MTPAELQAIKERAAKAQAAPSMQKPVFAGYARQYATDVPRLVERVEELEGIVQALKAGAPIVRCCEHCETCKAEQALEAPDAD